jgi:glycosyltransferase involved in cell wall biosynthesis
VVIATYNYGGYLSEAIESVLAQTYQNIEIIVVDDGSTDNTKQVVSKYPKVKYIYQNRSSAKTPSRARNNGLTLSKGEFYLALDADDKLQPEYISKCIDRISPDKRVGFVWTATQEFGESSSIRWPRTLHHRFSVFRGTGGQLGAALTRRKAFDSVKGYDESLIALEDWDLAIRICLKGWKAKPIYEPLHYVRVHEGQQTTAARKYRLEKIIRQKYPVMRFYLPVSRAFDITVLTFRHPKTFLIRFWNKVVCRLFNCRKITETSLYFQ